jgi:hypothetical protein
MSPDERRKPKLFIGSSSSKTALSIAHDVQENLEHDAEAVPWDQNVFNLSQTNIESLVKALNSFDFAVFVLWPDDVTVSKGAQQRTARDNVIFELGLFIGHLGRGRVFIIVPRGFEKQLHLPSDLAGVAPADFDARTGNQVAALGPACNKIRRAMQELGNRDKEAQRETEAAKLASSAAIPTPPLAPVSAIKIPFDQVPGVPLGHKEIETRLTIAKEHRWEKEDIAMSLVPFMKEAPAPVYSYGPIRGPIVFDFWGYFTSPEKTSDLEKTHECFREKIADFCGSQTPDLLLSVECDYDWVGHEIIYRSGQMGYNRYTSSLQEEFSGLKMRSVIDPHKMSSADQSEAMKAINAARNTLLLLPVRVGDDVESQICSFITTNKKRRGFFRMVAVFDLTRGREVAVRNCDDYKVCCRLNLCEKKPRKGGGK